MKVRRDIGSVPLRSSSSTWSDIIDLVSTSDSFDADQLTEAASAMADIIAEEHPKEYPIIFTGCGPRLLIYLTYYSYAMDQGEHIDSLNWNPTECKNWKALVPSHADDLDWISKIFRDRAPRFTVYDVAKGVETEDDNNKSSVTSEISIDWSKAGK